MNKIQEGIAGILMLKNENRYILHEDGKKPEYTMLEQNIRRLRSMVGGLYIVDNGSTDGSFEVYEQYKDFIRFIHFNDKRVSFDDVRDRKILLNEVLEDKMKWAFIIDGDEIYEEKTDEWLHRFCREHDSNGHYTVKFHYINLWRGRTKYRTDAWSTSWFPRLFGTGNLVLRGGALHNYSFGFEREGFFGPGNIIEGPVKCLHYGWADWDHRIKKTLRYMQRDIEISGISYEQAKEKYSNDLNEAGLTLTPALPEWSEEFRTGKINY